MATNKRQREQRRIALLQERIARKYERVLAKSVVKATKQMVESWEITGAVTLPFEHTRELDEAVKRIWSDAIKLGGEQITQQFKSARGPRTLKDAFGFSDNDIFERLLGEYVASVGGDYITNISETTRDLIMRSIFAGRRDGLGQRDIAKRILDANVNIARGRAALIARTETHQAANYSAHETAAATGVQFEKVWVATNGKRTRDDHRDADDQKVPMDGFFDVGGDKLRYPGDRNGKPANVINCRCAVIYEAI